MLILKCCSCEQEFKISFENLHNKISIQCNNCDQPLPKKALEPLRNLGNAYMDMIDALHYENTYENSWSVSVESSNEYIPDRKNRYGFQTPGTDDSFWSVRRKPFKPEDKKDLGILLNDDLPY